MLQKPSTKNYRRKITALRDSSLDFQFGFESELEDFVPALQYYDISPQVLLNGATGDARGAALKDYCRSLEHGDKQKILLRKPGAPSFLPDHLHRDDTGNGEFVLGPTRDLAALEKQAREVSALLGLGSVQAMVSLPRDQFFGENPSEKAQEHLGWLNFFNELDILERLEDGSRRLSSRPSSEPLRSFLHPYLGPMIALRHRLLRKFLRENALGSMLDPESLIRPARRDQSFKFVGSTAYRPDVAGPDRSCFEVRDAHKDLDLLFERVARIVYYWSTETTGFASFANVAPFDSAAAFEQLPQPVQTWLKATCFTRIPARVMEFEKARFTYEVYRNFAYPLRAWDDWLEVLGGKALEDDVRRAQEQYVSRLSAAAEAGEGRLAAQAALVSFAAGLPELFRRREAALSLESEMQMTSSRSSSREAIWPQVGL